MNNHEQNARSEATRQSCPLLLVTDSVLFRKLLGVLRFLLHGFTLSRRRNVRSYHARQSSRIVYWRRPNEKQGYKRFECGSTSTFQPLASLSLHFPFLSRPFFPLLVLTLLTFLNSPTKNTLQCITTRPEEFRKRPTIHTLTVPNNVLSTLTRNVTNRTWSATSVSSSETNYILQLGRIYAGAILIVHWSSHAFRQDDPVISWYN